MKRYLISFENEEIDLEKLRVELPYAVQSIEVQEAEKEGIFFRVKNRLEKINPKEIWWIQANDVYSIIRTTKARYLVSHTLKSLEERLSKVAFLRVHRSYLVRISEINAIEDGEIIIGSDYIPVGQTHKDELYKRLDFM